MDFLISSFFAQEREIGNFERSRWKKGRHFVQNIKMCFLNLNFLTPRSAFGWPLPKGQSIRGSPQSKKKCCFMHPAMTGWTWINFELILVFFALIFFWSKWVSLWQFRPFHAISDILVHVCGWYWLLGELFLVLGYFEPFFLSLQPFSLVSRSFYGNFWLGGSYLVIWSYTKGVPNSSQHTQITHFGFHVHSSE